MTLQLVYGRGRRITIHDSIPLARLWSRVQPTSKAVFWLLGLDLMPSGWLRKCNLAHIKQTNNNNRRKRRILLTKRRFCASTSSLKSLQRSTRSIWKMKRTIWSRNGRYMTSWFRYVPPRSISSLIHQHSTIGSIILPQKFHLQYPTSTIVVDTDIFTYRKARNARITSEWLKKNLFLIELRSLVL